MSFLSLSSLSLRERESEAFVLGSGREWEFPLTPVVRLAQLVKVFRGPAWSGGQGGQGGQGGHVGQGGQSGQGGQVVIGQGIMLVHVAQVVIWSMWSRWSRWSGYTGLIICL